MRCGHCKRSDAAIDVNHVRACQMINSSTTPTAFGHEPTPTVVAERKAAAAPVTEEGFYKVGDEFVKVLRSETSGHLYTKVWEPVALLVDGDLVDTCGSWEYTAGLLRLMNADQRITAEQAHEFGMLYSRCVFCSRKLTDDRSIAAGYGETCAENNGLPWGEVAA